MTRLTETDRRVLRLAFPALGALAAEPAYRLVDTAIVGRIGTDELGGLAIAVSVLSLVIVGANFLAYGTTERVARRWGAGEAAAAGTVAVQAQWIALAVGVLALPLLLVGAPTFTSALGADDEVLDVAVLYLRISALGVPFVLLGLAAQGAQRGVSDYRSSLVVAVVANVVNVVVELVFVFGFDWGVAGAAWSTVLAQVIAGLALWWRTLPVSRQAAIRRPRWSEIRPLMNAGRHLLLRVAAMLVVFTGATSLAARIDEPTLAAHQIAVSVFLFLALSLDALAVPSQTLVAEELGRDDAAMARTVADRALRMSLALGLVLALLLAATAPLLVRAFTADPAVVDRGTVALWFLAAVLIPGSAAFATDGSLIGAGDYRFLGLAAVGYLVLVVPIAAVVLAVDGLGIAGIWLGLLVWMTARAIVNRARSNLVLDRARADVTMAP